MLLISCSFVKVTTLLGLLTLLWVEHHSVFCKIPTIELLDNAAFFHSLGVIGAILYLASAECSGKKCGKKEKEEKKAEKSAEKVADKFKDSSKGGKKDKRH